MPVAPRCSGSDLVAIWSRFGRNPTLTTSFDMVGRLRSPMDWWHSVNQIMVMFGVVSSIQIECVINRTAEFAQIIHRAKSCEKARISKSLASKGMFDTVPICLRAVWTGRISVSFSYASLLSHRATALEFASESGFEKVLGSRSTA